MKSIVIAFGSALATLAVVGSCSVVNRGMDKALLGECAPANRVAPKDTYNSVALKMIYGRLSTFSVHSATQETVAAQLGRIAALRAEAPEKVSDKCLLQEVSNWLDYYEREARGAVERRRQLNGYSSEYEKERIEQEDRARALSQYLRAAPL